MSERSQTLVVVGVDDSEQSRDALEWTLDHLFSPFEGQEVVRCPFAIFLLHARPTGAPDIGATVIATAVDICSRRGLEHVHSDVMDGDAGNVLCNFVETYPDSILVVGSATDRADLGSVSDYCARHAKRPVMIVKKPN